MPEQHPNVWHLSSLYPEFRTAHAAYSVARVALVSFALVCAAFLPHKVGTAESVPDLAARTIGKLNTIRKAAGLGPVTYDAELSKGCTLHAQYVAKMLDSPFNKLGDLQDEDPAAPGFTEEGRAAAKASAVDPRVGPVAWVDWQQATLGYRVFLLAPDLKRVGVGYARRKSGEWVSVFDSSRGWGTDQVVSYPVEDQEDVPLSFFGGEVPDPIPDAKDKRAGYPVTVTFPRGTPVKDVTALMRDGSGGEVDVWLSTPEKPAYKPDFQMNTICLMAKTPLKPHTTYAVTIEARVGGKPWKRTWRFTTTGETTPQENVGQQVVEKINAARKAAGVDPVALHPELSRGCAAHARYLVQNADNPATQGAGTRSEDLSLPGATPEGREVAARCFANVEPGDPTAFVERCLGLVYRRGLILEPALTQIGFGCARGEGKGWLYVFVPRGKDRASPASPVAYPADGQKDVPLMYSAEGDAPDSLPQSKDKRAGFPVTVMFPRGAAVKAVTAGLTDDSGRVVETWFAVPDQPGGQEAAPLPVISLIPKDPLRPKASYSAKMKATVNGEAWERAWSFSTADDGLSDPAEAEAKVLARVNSYRKTAGLEPVVAVDPSLSRGCLAHARYMVRNSFEPSMATLDAHNEHEDWPAYTEEGRRAGKASVLAVAEPVSGVDQWMSTFFHRVPILNPELRRIGLGYCKGGRHGRALVMDVGSATASDKPIAYPGDEQTGVPLTFSRGEIPDPIPESKGKPAGFPITVTFPPSVAVTHATATLKDAAGKDVDFWLATPEKPAVADRQLQTISLIAKAPLRPNTGYTVTVTADADGKPWKKSWTFTTGK